MHLTKDVEFYQNKIVELTKDNLTKGQEKNIYLSRLYQVIFDVKSKKT